MVDALRRAQQMMTANGVVVDVHPTAGAAAVQIDGRTTGHVDGGDAPRRHAAADAALKTAIEKGLFTRIATAEFDFFTYGDTIEQLRDYIAETGRNARIDDETVARTRDALLAAPPGSRPRVRERVRLTTLRPITRRRSRASQSGRAR
jgi:hypothetical protein